MMKIVIISQTFYPKNSPRSHRATELAREFVRQGHKVVVYALTGSFNHAEFSSQTGIEVNNLGIARFGLPTSTDDVGKKKIHRLCRFLGKPLDFPDITMIPMVKKAIKKEGCIDLLITIAIPHVIHFATSLADTSKVKTWIADCGDPFMGNPFHKPPFYFENFERKWCEKCDFISVPMEDAIDAYYPEYREKIKVIPQGFNFRDIKLASYTPNDVPTFAYSGVFYKDLRDPSKFLEYLCSLDINFKFVCYTKSKALLQPFKEKLQDKLEIRNYIPREKLLFELSQMDFLVNVLNKSGVQQPSKLIDYALTKRPIANLSSCFTEEEKNTIKEFFGRNYCHQHKVQNVEQYNIQNVANQFLALVK